MKRIIILTVCVILLLGLVACVYDCNRETDSTVSSPSPTPPIEEITPVKPEDPSNYSEEPQKEYTNSVGHNSKDFEDEPTPTPIPTPCPGMITKMELARELSLK